MRLFIAIDIDEKVRGALSDLQRQLQRRTDEEGIKKRDVKWVRPEAIHLTLKFLGEVKDEKAAEICNIVRDVSGWHRGFELDIRSVGCFGGKAARVLWVGTGRGSEQLSQLAKGLDEQLASAGWPKETREFSGHLTVCRIKSSSAGVKLAAMSEEYRDLELGVISVDALSVYQSQLTPKGPIYTRLANCELQ
jgi:2'-5' RNA ligase